VEAAGTVPDGDGAGTFEAACEGVDGAVGCDAPDLAGAIGGHVEAPVVIDRETVEDRGAGEGARAGVGEDGGGGSRVIGASGRSRRIQASVAATPSR